MNEKANQKFPQKTSVKLQPNLQADSIISFAYFFKMMKFNNPFNKTDVNFKGVLVPSFEAKKLEQKRQVRVHSYKNDENFVIQLETKSQNDHIYFIKTVN